MSAARAILGAALGAILGGVSGVLLGLACVEIFAVSDFEGQSGYLVGFLFLPAQDGALLRRHGQLAKTRPDERPTA